MSQVTVGLHMHTKSVKAFHVKRWFGFINLITNATTIAFSSTHITTTITITTATTTFTIITATSKCWSTGTF